MDPSDIEEILSAAQKLRDSGEYFILSPPSYSDDSETEQTNSLDGNTLEQQIQALRSGSWIISPAEVEFTRVIGEGSNGKVSKLAKSSDSLFRSLLGFIAMKKLLSRPSKTMERQDWKSLERNS